ncbi:MAG: isoprenyl transferase [Bacteroidota bacterium]|nr:isoprenyl transferase [Bacteroidota bacterium]
MLARLQNKSQEGLLGKIDPKALPKHVAVIMDGNGRWAKQKGKVRIFGHNNAIKAVRETAETCAELGIRYLTLYAFSTENWQRPKKEVNALMNLLVESLNQEEKTLQDNNIKLEVIGNTDSLPQKTKDTLNKVIGRTKDNKRMTLVLALSYSAKWDIVNSVKNIAREVVDGKITIEEIDEKKITNSLTTKAFPHPDLLIRTSGELRLSNFLLWELAYSEFYFTNVLWPDFRRENLMEAIFDYQKRNRRYGRVEN